jgi:hypothetical protein
MKIPFKTYKMREMLWYQAPLSIKEGFPEMKEVLKIVRQSDIDIKSLDSRKTPRKLPPKTPLQF